MSSQNRQHTPAPAPAPGPNQEFKTIMDDFMRDLILTFPEYNDIIIKYADRYQFLYEFCQKTYPPQFFNILYKNEALLHSDKSEGRVELFPELDFVKIMNCPDISLETRDTIWKYLQLILFSIIGTIKDADAFGQDTTNLFGGISADEMQTKMTEVMDGLRAMFPGAGVGDDDETGADAGVGEGAGAGVGDFPFDISGDIPNIQNHLQDILGGKIGQFATELADEWATEFDIDLESAADTAPMNMFDKLMKDPTKMYTLIQKIGERFQEKMASGEFTEKELRKEAKQIAEKFKNIPGMERMNSILSKLTQGKGRGGGASAAAAAANLNVNAMRKQMEFEAMKERLQKNRERLHQQKLPKWNGGNNATAATTTTATTSVPAVPVPVPLTDDQLADLFENTGKSNKADMGTKTSTNGKRKHKK
jgi:hypothetical protein